MQVSREQLIEKVHNIYPFNHLDEDSILKVINQSEVLFFEQDNLVYLEGAEANSLYILLEGEASILLEKSQSLYQVNILRKGSVFGEDIFHRNKKRRTTARIKKNAMILKVPERLIEHLILRSDKFKISLKIISSSYETLIQNPPAKFPEESITYIGRPHILVFFQRFFIYFMGSIAIALTSSYFQSLSLVSVKTNLWVLFLILSLLIVVAVWFLIDWRNNVYIFSNKRIINLNRRLLRLESVLETPLNAITNLKLFKTFLGRIINFGNLSIKTYTGESVLKAVPFDEHVLVLLEHLIKTSKNNQHEEEKESFRKILTASHSGTGLIKDDKTIEKNNNQNTNTGSKNGIFFESSGYIYRTHWIILIRKVLIPTLLIVSTFLVTGFLSANSIFRRIDIPALSLLFLSMAVMVIWWVYQFFDWFNDRYQIINNQIVDVNKKPLGSENSRSASLFNIQSIRYERNGFLGLLLNFGTVYIRIGDEEFTFDNVPNPASVQSTLFLELEKSMAGKKKADLTDQQIKVANWLETFHEYKKERNKNTQEE